MGLLDSMGRKSQTALEQKWEDLISRATRAATFAMAAKLTERPHWFPCGFAWVTIDGTHPFARHCRKRAEVIRDRHNYGGKGYPKGWQFWCPGEYNGQSMVVYKAGADAFAQVLREAGIVCVVGERMD